VPNNVTEIQQAKAWIYTALHSNSDIVAACATRIYDGFVPVPAPSRIYPYILFNFMAGLDVDGLGTNRLQSQPLFQVRVVDVTPISTTARTLDKRITDVLGVAVYQLSGDYYFTARREQSIDRPELDTATGKQLINLGGLFRLYIGRTP
jgi:hypothetical protein